MLAVALSVAVQTLQVTIDACVCDRGFRLDVASSACVACESGSYKAEPGNLEACTACPVGTVTFSAGSVFAASCVADTSGSNTGDGNTGGNTGGGSTGGGNTGGTDDNQSMNESNESNESNSSIESNEGSVSQQNESDVPAITFNMSLGNFPVTSDVETIRVQVIAAWLDRTDAHIHTFAYHTYIYYMIYFCY